MTVKVSSLQDKVITQIFLFIVSDDHYINNDLLAMKGLENDLQLGRQKSQNKW
jgi:hypothetical protein